MHVCVFSFLCTYRFIVWIGAPSRANGLRFASSSQASPSAIASTSDPTLPSQRTFRLGQAFLRLHRRRTPSPPSTAHIHTGQAVSHISLANGQCSSHQCASTALSLSDTPWGDPPFFRLSLFKVVSAYKMACFCGFCKIHFISIKFINKQSVLTKQQVSHRVFVQFT